MPAIWVPVSCAPLANQALGLLLYNGLSHSRGAYQPTYFGNTHSGWIIAPSSELRTMSSVYLPNAAPRILNPTVEAARPTS